MLEENNTSANNTFDPSYEFKIWDDLDIDPNILRGVYSHGFEKPSPIQQKAILPIIKGRDIIAQAQSGTGKTATFTIGALSLIDLKDNSTQALILSPTRELCQQTSIVIHSIGGLIHYRHRIIAISDHLIIDNPYYLDILREQLESENYYDKNEEKTVEI